MAYFDRCTTLQLSYLKKIGMLDHSMSSSVFWSYTESGEHAASIGVRSEITGHAKTIHLKYTSNGEPIEYSVKLRSVESNLGNGVVWYFECPVTGLLCRKLYGIGKYFLHRKAYKHVYYYSQDYSRSFQKENQVLFALLKSDKLYKEVLQKYYKRSYNGKLTKRYIRLRRKADRIYPILNTIGVQQTLSNHMDWSKYDWRNGIPIA
jgi:hypothetical protein